MSARRDEATIHHGKLTVVLRPTLRAALRLEAMHGGWQALFRRVDQFDTATVREIIRLTATDRQAAEELLGTFQHASLTIMRNAVSEPVGELLALFLIGDDEDPDESQDDTQGAPQSPVAWSKTYRQLYQIGTAWCGWTPAETWAATPNEITQALAGHVAKLTATSGASNDAPSRPGPSKAERQSNRDAGLDPDFDRAGLQRLREMA